MFHYHITTSRLHRHIIAARHIQLLKRCTKDSTDVVLLGWHEVLVFQPLVLERTRPISLDDMARKESNLIWTIDHLLLNLLT